MTYKQPHEDITGTDRTGDYLLSLDDPATAHREALIAMARLLREACLVGRPAPIVARIGERIHTPQIGDLVVEQSAIWTRPAEGFGYLIERREEYWHTDEQWQADLAAWCGDPRPTDEAWYVQYGPQPVDVCRWTNCSFIVLPIGDDFRSPLGERDATGGFTITRAGLLGTLADSGFELSAAGGDDRDSRCDTPP